AHTEFHTLSLHDALPISPVEILVLMPDGKLMLRDSVADAADTERVARRRTWDERIKDIKKGGDKGPARPGEGGIFDRPGGARPRSEEHTSELQSQSNLVC